MSSRTIKLQDRLGKNMEFLDVTWLIADTWLANRPASLNSVFIEAQREMSFRWVVVFLFFFKSDLTVPSVQRRSELQQNN